MPQQILAAIVVNDLVLVFAGLVLLFLLVVVVVFAGLARLWMQCFLANAQVSAIQIVMMKLRRSNAARICRLRIMSAQAGIPIPVHELEQASLAGVDVELAVRALIRAKEEGLGLTWEEALSRAKIRQFDDYFQQTT